MNPIENYISEAFELVESWETPDEALANAVTAEARLLAGFQTDDYWVDDSYTPTQ